MRYTPETLLGFFQLFSTLESLYQDLTPQERAKEKSKFLIETILPHLVEVSLQTLNDKDFEFIYKEFLTLYDKEFSHSYALIKSYLLSVYTDTSKQPQLLLNNLSMLVSRTYKEKTLVHSHKALHKLYDYVESELLNLDYLSEQLQMSHEVIRSHTQKAISELQERSNTTEEQLQKTQELADDTRSKINDTTQTYISILSIFAAIVMVFFGGVSLSTSVLQTLSTSPLSSIFMITSVLGTIFFNIIFLFLYVICKHARGVDGFLKIITLCVNIAMVIVFIIGFCYYS